MHIIVSAENVGQRLDLFLSTIQPEHSRSYFNRLIREGLALVNGQGVKTGYLLRKDDAIEISHPERSSALVPANIPLNIVFEDEHLLVINKAAGMTVHPGHGTAGDTLVHALLHHSGELAEGGSPERPGIVHRLDKDTSGLLVIAKNESALTELRKQFDRKTIRRIYWALVWGKFAEGRGTIHTFLERSRRDPTRYTVGSKGREAITHYTVLRDFEYISLTEIELDTGRTHQIRVHMNHIQHPVFGDPDYNGRESQLGRLPANLRKRGQNLLELTPRQALHAKKLSFLHPQTRENMQFECDLPNDFSNLLAKISNALNGINLK
jgi:23S rRNA pseudouridine1911/1915/1917 synthase